MSGIVYKNIAVHFFEATEKRPTPAMFSRTIGVAKTLVQSGYDEEEIKKAIDYTVKHPPKNGFHSLGWLSYTIDSALEGAKAESVKKCQTERKEVDSSKIVNHNAEKFKKSKKGINDSFDIDLF